MNFAEPIYLYGFLLLLPLGLLVWRAERRRRALLARLGEMPLLARLTETVNENGRKWSNRLWFVALGLLLVALARPQWGSETQLVQQEGVQVMVVLDVSTSMLADDLRPSRLAQAKQSMVELMAALDGDEVGLVLFSGASFIQFPLTTDYGTARSFLDAAGPSVISRPGSVLGLALETAVSGFNLQRDSQRVIVVMTDGESHEGNPIEAATAAAEEGVLIYTIGFGSPEGEAVPQLDGQGRVIGSRMDGQGNIILSRLDEATLEEVAAVGNGRYFRATASGREIDALAEEIGQLQAAQLESRFQTQRIERFQLFLGAAIVILLGLTLIPRRKTAVGKPQAAEAGDAEATPRLRPTTQSTNLLILLLLLAGCTATPTPADQVNSGNAAYEQGEYEAALGEYQEAIAALPKTAEPVYNSANALFRNAQLAEAQAQMDIALLDAEEELAADAYFNLGNFYYSQQDYVNAIEAYKSGLRLDSSDEDAKHNLELALRQQQEESGEEEQEQEEEQQDEPEPDEESQEEQEPEEEQSGEEESDEPQEEEQPQEQEGGEQEEDAEETPPETADQPEENSSSQQPPVEGLTEEQAYQLLEAIGQQTETLQEFLQEQFTAPGGPPERDW